jgi:hypothetical protein
MKKEIVSRTAAFIAMLLAMAFVTVWFTGCDNPAGGEKKAPFIAVTDITGLPVSVAVDEEIDLGAAVVAPGDATNKTIAWSVTAPGAGVTAIPDTNKLTPAEEGVFTVTATIADGKASGTPFTKDFPVAVGILPVLPETFSLTLTALSGKVIAKASGAVGAESYIFRIGTTEGGDGATESEVTAASKEFAGLENGTAYYVWVKAQNRFGGSAFFGPVSATPSEVHLLEADNAAGALTELTAYLALLEENTPATAYAVKFAAGVNIGDFWGESGTSSSSTTNDDALKHLFDAIGTGKYVSVDLSDCSCDYTSTGVELNVIPSTGGSALNQRPQAGDGNKGGYLVSLDLPDTVISIGSGFLSDNKSLVSVGFPDTLTEIGGGAFSNTGLTSVRFPAALASLAGSSGVSTAFSNCASLVSVEFDENAPVAVLPSQFFQNCPALQSVTLPAAVKRIGTSTFDNCTALRSINLENIEVIWPQAFRNTALVSVNLPVIAEIKNGAFQNCANLTQVVLGSDDLYSIEAETFANCPELSSLEIPKNVKSFAGNSVISGHKAGFVLNLDPANDWFELRDNGTILVSKDPETPNTLVAYIGDAAEFTIPEDLTSIGPYAFSGCTLTGITLPSGITSIGADVFAACANLTTITIPGTSTYTAIAARTFRNWTGLTSISIPATITSIEANAFSGCGNLVSVTFEGNSTVIASSNSFPGDLKKFYDASAVKQETYTLSGSTWMVPAQTAYIEDFKTMLSVLEGAGSAESPHTVVLTATNISDIWFGIHTAVQNAEKYVILDLSNCTASGNTITGSSSSGPLDKNVMNIIKANQYIKGVILPSALVTIGDHAFRDCVYLTEISIPSTVTTIKQYAFSGCTLTGITLPSGVTSIGSYVFAACANLTTITIPSTYTAIAGNTFRNWTGLERISIPAAVTSIAAYAFDGCGSLVNVTFEGNDTAIANANSFPQSLKTVYDAQETKQGTYTLSAGSWTKQP